MAVTKSEPVPIFVEFREDLVNKLFDACPTKGATLQDIIEALVNEKQHPVSLDAALVACDVLAEFFTSGFAKHGISAQAAYEIRPVLDDIKATLTAGEAADRLAGRRRP